MTCAFIQLHLLGGDQQCSSGEIQQFPRAGVIVVVVPSQQDWILCWDIGGDGWVGSMGLTQFCRWVNRCWRLRNVQRLNHTQTQIDYHLIGIEGCAHTPQVLPLEILMNPFSPHELPQEFLIRQQSLLMPVKSTPWFRLPLQFESTPDWYGDQLELSTATDTGPWSRALVKAVQPGVVVQVDILKDPREVWQVPLTALQGQADSVVIPWALTQLKADSMLPPLQPVFPQAELQSMSCCSENSWRVPLLIFPNPSNAPVEENAQQDPQLPWFFTDVTAPYEDQSSSLAAVSVSSTWSGELVLTNLRYISTNSILVRQVNWLMPMVQVWFFCELWYSMAATFSLQITSLNFSSKPFLKCRLQMILYSLNVRQLLLERVWQPSRARLTTREARIKIRVLGIACINKYSRYCSWDRWGKSAGSPLGCKRAKGWRA